MDLISSLPILLDKNKKVNYEEMKVLIDSLNIKGIHLFSSLLEGQTFSLSDKEEIMKRIKQISKQKIYYETSNSIDNDEIKLINKIKPNYLIIPLFLDAKLKSKGFEKHVQDILKKVKTPTLIKLNDSFLNCKISYSTIVNLCRLNNFFYGIIDETKDNFFINKLNYLSSLKKYTSFSKYLLLQNKNNINAICTDLNLIIPKEIEQYFFERELGFVNPVLNEYLMFVDDCINYYPRGMALKYLLKKKGYKAYYSKLPYYLLKGEEKDKLDFIF